MKIKGTRVFSIGVNTAVVAVVWEMLSRLQRGHFIDWPEMLLLCAVYVVTTIVLRAMFPGWFKD